MPARAQRGFWRSSDESPTASGIYHVKRIMLRPAYYLLDDYAYFSCIDNKWYAANGDEVPVWTWLKRD